MVTIRVPPLALHSVAYIVERAKERFALGIILFMLGGALGVVLSMPAWYTYENVLTIFLGIFLAGGVVGYIAALIMD